MQELDSRLSFVVDDQAEPVDFDTVLAQYLLTLVRSEAPADLTSLAEIDSQSEAER